MKNKFIASMNKENTTQLLTILAKLQVENDYITDEQLLKQYKTEIGQDLRVENSLDEMYEFRQFLWTLKNYIQFEVEQKRKEPYYHYPMTYLKLTNGVVLC